MTVTHRIKRSCLAGASAGLPKLHCAPRWPRETSKVTGPVQQMWDGDWLQLNISNKLPGDPDASGP